MPDDLLTRLPEVATPRDVDLFRAEHAEAIRVLGRRVIGDIIEIGRRLIAVRKVTPHGEWLPWLDAEFGWKERTARNYIAVAEGFASKTAPRADLPIDAHALYLLAGQSVPEAARDKAIEQAETGERITLAKAQELIDKAREEGEQAARAEFDDMVVLSQDELSKKIATITTKANAAIVKVQKDRDKLADRLEKAALNIKALQTKPAKTASKAPTIADFDSTTSFRAMCIAQAVSALRKELRITPRQLIDIERQLATDIHQQPQLAVAKLAALNTDARQVLNWLQSLIETLEKEG